MSTWPDEGRCPSRVGVDALLGLHVAEGKVVDVGPQAIAQEDVARRDARVEHALLVEVQNPRGGLHGDLDDLLPGQVEPRLAPQRALQASVSVVLRDDAHVRQHERGMCVAWSTSRRR